MYVKTTRPLNQHVFPYKIPNFFTKFRRFEQISYKFEKKNKSWAKFKLDFFDNYDLNTR